MQNNNLSIRTLKKSKTLIFFIPLLLIIIVSTYLTTSPLLNSNQVFAEDHCSYTISASTDDSSTTGIEVPNGGSVMITFSGSSFYTLNFLIDGASGGSETITDEDGLQDGSGTLTRTVPTNSQDKNITVRVSTGSGVRRENCSVSGSNVVNVGSAQPPDGGNEDDGGSPPNGDNDGDGGSPPSGGDNDGDGGNTSGSGVIDIGEAFLFGGKGVREVFPDLGTLVTSIINLALAAAGIVFFIMFVWGGIRYITAGGDEKSISDAKGTLSNAVVGLLIVISSFAIIRLIALATGATISIF